MKMKNCLALCLALALVLALVPGVALAVDESDVETAQRWQNTFATEWNNGAGVVSWQTLWAAVGSYSVVKGHSELGEGVTE